MNRQSVNKAQKAENSALLASSFILQRRLGNQAGFKTPAVDTMNSIEPQVDNRVPKVSQSHFSYDFSNIPVSSKGSFPIQAKLKIGQPNDKYEQEADQVAEQVMRMPDSGLSTFITDSSSANRMNFNGGAIQRSCNSCSQEYKTAEEEKRSVEAENLCPKCRTQAGFIQTKQKPPQVQRQQSQSREGFLQTKSMVDKTPEVTADISSGIQTLQGGGQPLSQSERSFFEPRFGTDFSNVRVHNNSTAANLARAVNARAFTLGNNVVFGAGEHGSDSIEGRRLLAHELTHVLQQNQSLAPVVQRYTAAEREECPCLDWSLARMWAYARSMVTGGAIAGHDHASAFMEQFLDEDSNDADVPFSDVQSNQGGQNAINMVTNRLINRFVQAGEALECGSTMSISRSASAPGHFSSGTDLFYAMGAFTIRASASATVTKFCVEGECDYIEIEVNINYRIDDLYDWKFEPGGCTPSTGESGCTANIKKVNLPVLGEICDECLNRLVINGWAAEFMVKVRDQVDDYYDAVDCGERYADDDVSPRPEDR